MTRRNDDEEKYAELVALQDKYSQKYGTGELTPGQHMVRHPHSEMSEFQAKVDAAKEQCEELRSR